MIVLGLGAAYWRWHRPVPLGESVSLLVGEFTLRSGEDDFDGSLREVLRGALLPSPFLNLVSDEKIRTTLGGMGKPEGEPLTVQLSDSLCERVGANLFAVRSKNSYQQFFTLWKTADSDIPILGQARAEAAKLH
jgi:hypothetical protein